MLAAVHSAVLNCQHIGLSRPHWFSFYDFYCVKIPSNKKRVFLSHCGQVFSSYKQMTLSFPVTKVEELKVILAPCTVLFSQQLGVQDSQQNTHNYFHAPLALSQHSRDYWASVTSKTYSSLNLPQSWCYFSHTPLQLHSSKYLSQNLGQFFHFQIFACSTNNCSTSQLHNSTRRKSGQKSTKTNTEEWNLVRCLKSDRANCRPPWLKSVYSCLITQAAYTFSHWTAIWSGLRLFWEQDGPRCAINNFTSTHAVQQSQSV